MSDQKQINFAIVPEEPEDPARARREYANFCAVAHTPFDMTLTFCDVRPLSESDIRSAEASQTVKAPVVARIAVPFAVVPGLIAASVGPEGVIESAAWGVRKRGGTEAVTTSDQFSLGSNSKSFTATLAAVLVEEGVINWSTTVAEVLPRSWSSLSVCPTPGDPGTSRTGVADPRPACSRSIGDSADAPRSVGSWL